MQEKPPSSKVRIVQPYPITHRFKALKEFEGRTILDLMSTRFPFREVHLWEEKIRDGKIGVNGKEVSPDHILKKDDEIFHFNPKVIEPSVPDEVEILEETENYLIVKKPAPLPMHPGGRYNKNSLTFILAEKGFDQLRIVHRLDAVTSGLVLFAKNKAFAKKAMICFSEGKVEKTYYAFVDGVPDEKTKVLDAPIRRKTGFVFESEIDLEQAKDAVTEFEVVKEFEDSAIIKCRPRTGRTHQIRLHLEKWGFPIIDDPIYGRNGDKSSKRAQNIAISLFNAGLKIDELGIDHSLDLTLSGFGSRIHEP